MHKAHALGQMLLAFLRRPKSPLEVVDDGQQLANETALGPFAGNRCLTRRPLAVVLEIRLDSLREREVVVGLLGVLGLLDDPLLLVCGVLLAGGLAGLVA